MPSVLSLSGGPVQHKAAPNLHLAQVRPFALVTLPNPRPNHSSNPQPHLRPSLNRSSNPQSLASDPNPAMVQVLHSLSWALLKEQDTRDASTIESYFTRAIKIRRDAKNDALTAESCNGLGHFFHLQARHLPMAFDGLRWPSIAFQRQTRSL